MNSVGVAASLYIERILLCVRRGGGINRTITLLNRVGIFQAGVIHRKCQLRTGSADIKNAVL